MPADTKLADELAILGILILIAANIEIWWKRRRAQQ